ncbi:MAG TPA: Crp/Fnr family transcriptional regulator [Spirochaetia bacterium]|nr:Crp/Fnr family transcriptional regulator [Spirochaetia bacterium]
MAVVDVQSLLEQSDFFRALSPARRRSIGAICIPKALSRRQTLFMEGETGQSMYLMAQGVVQLFKTSAEGKEVVIKLVRPGEIFGEVVLFQRDRYPVSACALTPAEVFLLPRRQFDLLLDDGEFRREFIGMLLEKQRFLAEQIFRFSALDVEQRFFHFLREQYGEREEYTVDVTKRELAAAIDALPETLSRLLLKLKEEGAILWEGGSLRVRKGFWQDRVEARA